MTKGSLAVKQWRESFKKNDPEGYKLYRQRERAKEKQRETPERKKLNTFQSYKGSLKILYGITYEIYCAMLKRQRGKCALCGEYPKKGERLAVDHNHVTGQVRGLVHKWPCNLLIGYQENFGKILVLAEVYLKKYA
jgi:hypothetical protein